MLHHSCLLIHSTSYILNLIKDEGLDLIIKLEIFVLGQDLFILVSLETDTFMRRTEEETIVTIVIRVNIVLKGLLFRPLMPSCNARSVTGDFLTENSVIKKYISALITKAPRRTTGMSAAGTLVLIAFSIIMTYAIFDEGLVKENSIINEAKSKILVTTLSLFLAGSSNRKLERIDDKP